MGYHAVKVVGWGYDWWSESSYFICQNSWGVNWGMGGFFNVKEGEVNIDKEAYYCDLA